MNDLREELERLRRRVAELESQGAGHVTGDGIVLTILGDLPPEPRLGLAPGSFPKTIEASLALLHADDLPIYEQAVERSQESG